MKTAKYLKTLACCVVLLAVALPGKAQLIPNTYINVDWQMGVPLDNGLADKTSGWGMNFEGGYFVTPAITVGPFLSYQTNLESIDRQTLDLGDGAALTTNQKHALFQLPFGVASRYNWLTDSIFQPYVGLKLGASYAELSSYYYVVGILPLARGRRLDLPAPGLPHGHPRGPLLQLRHQRGRRAGLPGQQPQQLRTARRYLVLTPEADPRTTQKPDLVPHKARLRF